MARVAKAKPTKSLEQTLWEAADKLRGNQEPREYKHVVLGLVFLKYISDRFAERRGALETELTAEGLDADDVAKFLEDRDEYAAHNVFWVPASHGGTSYSVAQSSHRSAKTSTPRWMPSKPRTPASVKCCRATTLATGSTSVACCTWKKRWKRSSADTIE